jgi:RimJ/RimL family protein N-acetyltransferase
VEAPERIEGERVHLRGIHPDEAASILAGHLPQHLRFAEGYPAQNSVEVMDIFVGARRKDSPTFAPLFIVRSQDGAIIGEIGWSCPHGLSAPVVGYDVVEPLWGQGYATDALRALVAYLFSLPQVERVLADTLMTHIASRRVMEKAGLTFVRQAIEDVEGEAQEVVYYEIARRPAGAE